MYMSFLVNFGGHYRFIVLQLLSLNKLMFLSKFQLSMTIFHHKLLTREERVLANV